MRVLNCLAGGGQLLCPLSVTEAFSLSLACMSINVSNIPLIVPVVVSHLVFAITDGIIGCGHISNVL